MIGCIVISDRGDLYLPKTVEILGDALPAGMPIRIINDRSHRLGLAGSARLAWEVAVAEDWDALLHWEEDFRPVGGIPLPEMEDCLSRFPFLSQVVLKRQAWNAEEIAAGGLVECHPNDYSERSMHGRYAYTVHRRIFSLNPCLIPRSVLQLGWPDGNEATMTERLNRDPGNLFAIYGGKFDPPLVEHIGAERGAGWRL